MWHQIILLMNENSIKIETTCQRSQLRVTKILRRRGSQINVLINEGDKLSCISESVSLIFNPCWSGIWILDRTKTQYWLINCILEWPPLFSKSRKGKTDVMLRQLASRMPISVQKKVTFRMKRLNIICLWKIIKKKRGKWKKRKRLGWIPRPFAHGEKHNPLR